MKWQEVSPGRYERPFDSIESFYRLIASAGAHLNKQHYFISSTLRLKNLPPLKDVQNAWRALRQRYPQIAAIPDETGARFRYTVPSHTELDAWVQQSLIVDYGSSANEKNEGEQPSHMFLLFYLPGTRELLFRTPHWRIDGIGLMDLQNAFLRILANIPPSTIYLDGSEAKYLTPSLDGAAAVPLEVTPEITRSTNDEIAVYEQGQPSISIATLPNVIPTATRRIFSRFSPKITTHIISACKSRGLTVTAAMHAAMVVAILPHIQHNFDPASRGQSGGKFTGFNAFDLRKYIAPPFNGPAAAVNVYHTGIPFSIDLEFDRSFDSIAAKLLKQYKRDLSKDAPRNVFRFLAQYVDKVLSVLGSPFSDPLRAPAYPELSSLGIINDHIAAKHEGSASTVEVEDWWVAVQNISRLLIPHVWTWTGELVLSVDWNESFYEYAVVSQFLEGWKQTITEELGVN
ncbi:uncharacterized protein N7503_009536 [Penicillium pulvis]|uniref:uncharacterized protein n=1 Tax=Penicillium pulvis TaxID=1562058 RepID=UPI002548CAB5|nr:uncharacterized protein N7503_009536 [Penicillium pulvis]KAJ5784324.1 hypothetical protein N7503_009536 [Penicillium pulvis]